MTKEEIKIKVMMLKDKIPYPTYKTLLGQIEAGDLHGAYVGIRRLKGRLARKEGAYANRNR